MRYPETEALVVQTFLDVWDQLKELEADGLGAEVGEELYLAGEGPFKGYSVRIAVTKGKFDEHGN